MVICFPFIIRYRRWKIWEDSTYFYLSTKLRHALRMWVWYDRHNCINVRVSSNDVQSNMVVIMVFLGVCYERIRVILHSKCLVARKEWGHIPMVSKRAWSDQKHGAYNVLLRVHYCVNWPYESFCKLSCWDGSYICN